MHCFRFVCAIILLLPVSVFAAPDTIACRFFHCAEAECLKKPCTEGEGIMIFVDGSMYKGEFHKSGPNGKGVTKCVDGRSVQGKWNFGAICEKGDCENGAGRLLLSDCSSYEGSFKENLFSGRGRFTFPTGIFYEGTWRSGNYAQGNIFDREGKPLRRISTPAAFSKVDFTNWPAEKWEGFIYGTLDFPLRARLIESFASSFGFPTDQYVEAQLVIHGAWQNISLTDEGRSGKVSMQMDGFNFERSAKGAVLTNYSPPADGEAGFVSPYFFRLTGMGIASDSLGSDAGPAAERNAVAHCKSQLHAAIGLDFFWNPSNKGDDRFSRVSLGHGGLDMYHHSIAFTKITPSAFTHYGKKGEIAQASCYANTRHDLVLTQAGVDVRSTFKK